MKSYAVVTEPEAQACCRAKRGNRLPLFLLPSPQGYAL